MGIAGAMPGRFRSASPRTLEKNQVQVEKEDRPRRLVAARRRQMFFFRASAVGSVRFSGFFPNEIK